MVSGHAYRATHINHHRVFPGPDDPEGAAATLSIGRALVVGPLHVPRSGGGRSRMRVGVAAGCSRKRRFRSSRSLSAPTVCRPLLAYTMLALVGGWLYPLLTVRLPHAHPGEEAVTQARTLRGRVVPPLLLEQTYHLEIISIRAFRATSCRSSPVGSIRFYAPSASSRDACPSRSAAARPRGSRGSARAARAGGRRGLGERLVAVDDRAGRVDAPAACVVDARAQTAARC